MRKTWDLDGAEISTGPVEREVADGVARVTKSPVEVRPARVEGRFEAVARFHRKHPGGVVWHESRTWLEGLADHLGIEEPEIVWSESRNAHVLMIIGSGWER